MYAKITERCNMSCAHCGNNCTAKGRDMSEKVFAAVCQYVEDNEGDEGTITLGGGEPTLHPRFWQFMGLALSVGEVWLATNGSVTKTALRLAHMAKRGVIGCALSQDVYHDPIEDSVVQAFKRNPRKFYGDDHNPDRREIRDVTAKEIAAGRCDWGEDKCLCPDILVEPDGTVRTCGCADAPVLGNILTGFSIPEGFSYGECHKRQELVGQEA